MDNESDMLNKIVDEGYDAIKVAIFQGKIDYTSISRLLNLSPSHIERVFEHVFVKKHVITNGTPCELDPIYPILRAFENVMEAKSEGFEKQLFEHFIYESLIGELKKLNITDAHNAANAAGFTSELNPVEEIMFKEAIQNRDYDFLQSLSLH